MAERKQTKRRADYEVGYGKPPKHSQFKKGKSGNPKGRPKGTRNFKTDVKATLTSRVTVTRDGKPRKISTQKAMLWRLREKALNGDIRALNLLMALAQTFNNEELPLHNDLSGDDAALLAIYNARLLKGATTAKTDTKSTGQEPDNDTDASDEPASHSNATSQPGKRRRGVKRYRPRQNVDRDSDGED